MSNFQAMLHSLIHQYRDLETFVFALNQSVYRITKSDKFITFFIAEINLDNKELKYINAGHYPPILLSGGDVNLLKTGSSVIGAFEKLPSIQEETIKIKDDTLLFCFTDGLIDLKNEAGDYYDDDRLINFVRDNASLATEAFNQKLISDLEDFKGSQEYVDDIALLTAKIN
jgi:sigma-B regulation protein RsbU (phosphoserine phosphatase)